MDNADSQDQIRRFSLPDLFRLRDSLVTMNQMINSKYVIDSLTAVRAELDKREEQKGAQL